LRKAALITILILLIISGSYFGYEKFVNIKKSDQWDLVPASAVLVYESKDLVRVWNHLQDQPLWNTLKSLPGFARIENSITIVDSVGGKEGSLDRLLNRQSFMTSMHTLSRDDFGFIFYLDVSGTENLKIVEAILNHFQKQPGVSTDAHIYENYRITEMSYGDEEVFSYFYHQDYVIFSYSPILIEDVVRRVSGKADGKFRKNVESLFKIAKLENDEGNIYIDVNKIYLLLSVFYSSTPDELKDLVDFSDASFLDLKVLPNHTLFNGFTLDDPDKSEYMSIYNLQTPGKRTIDNLVSNRTAILFHYFLENPAQWMNDLKNYWKVNNRKQYDLLNDFSMRYNYAPAELFQWIGNELALIYLEPVGMSEGEKLIVVRSSDITEARNSLDRFAESLSLLVEDSLYVEEYGQYQLSQLYIEDLPSHLFGSLFNGFEQCFYTFHDNYVILGTSIQSLKTQINDMESENVWGKSVKVNQFLDSHTLEESNLSLIINTTRSWPILTGLLNDKWKAYFAEQERNLKQLEFVSLQFSNVEDKYYTSLSLQHRSKPIAQPERRKFNSIQYTQLDSRIITRPFVVRNHRDNSREVIMQDSTNRLNLISRNGELLWNRKLDAPIVGEIQQIDFYNNGKLQYFLATEKSIYIIDRNGKDVENFPVNTGLRIRTANIIDYDNSKKYRIVLSDDSGLQYLYNREGEILKGWDPLSVAGIQNLPLRHIRVRNRDCMIIEKADGTIHIVNRRGQYYSGFPLQLDTRLISPLYIEIGSGFSTTRLTTITEAGELITFNLKGNIVEKTQLIKPSEDTKFSIAVDGLKKTFIIARQELNRLTLLDRNGRELFEKSYATSNELSVQYYNFNSDTEIVLVTDREQEFTYVYSGNGELYNEVPVESSHEAGLMYFETRDLFNMYINYDDRTSILSFKKGN
jgi:hypothetical protein